MIIASILLQNYNFFLLRNGFEIVHFLPVFGCLGDSTWNCFPTVYSVVMGSFYFSNQDFSAKGVVKSVCVCGIAHETTPETTPEAEKSRLEKIDNPKIEI